MKVRVLSVPAILALVAIMCVLVAVRAWSGLAALLVVIVIFLVYIYRRKTDYVKSIKKLEEEKTGIIRNMSHEIRTPLNAIVGFSELLANSGDMFTEEERRQFAENITVNTNLLTVLLNDILSMAEMENGDSIPEPVETDSSMITGHSLKAVQATLKKDIRLYETSDLPEGFKIVTDPLRVQQILMNLLNNACKYTDQGEINLNSSYDSKTGVVTYSVTDTGCGIPMDRADEIFDRFVKLDDQKQGLGMGLALCREIALKLGGNVRLDTSYMGGSRFCLDLPVEFRP